MTHAGQDDTAAGWGSPPGPGPHASWPPPRSGPPGWGPPPAYGPPAYVRQPETESRAVLVLALGIASFFVFPVVPAVVALCLAPGARRTIRESGGWKTGGGMVAGGVITAWANIAMLVVIVLAFGLLAGTGVSEVTVDLPAIVGPS